jgi:hypothetical protein
MLRSSLPEGVPGVEYLNTMGLEKRKGDGQGQII